MNMTSFLLSPSVTGYLKQMLIHKKVTPERYFSLTNIYFEQHCMNTIPLLLTYLSNLFLKNCLKLKTGPLHCFCITWPNIFAMKQRKAKQLKKSLRVFFGLPLIDVLRMQYKQKEARITKALAVTNIFLHTCTCSYIQSHKLH